MNEEIFNHQEMAQIDRDLVDFIRGKRRFYQIKRWVEVAEDELTKEKIAALIARKFYDKLYTKES